MAARAIVTIVAESPGTPDALALIYELEASLRPLYPAGSRHGYSADRLAAEGVAFFVARVHGQPVACGGLLAVDGEYGEIKRMYVRPGHRGLGIGLQVLERLAEHARASRLAVLRLETGIHQVDAIRLYERAGFRRIPPFGPYTADPLSRCYERRLDG
jgi:putative acetyltransferase